MKKYIAMICMGTLICLGILGCSGARSRHDPEAIRNTAKPAFSLGLHQPDIVVAVSPVRQTMQIGGSIPTLLGAGITAVQDNSYAVRVREALGDYDPCAVFLEKMRTHLAAGFSQELTEVAPQGTAAGFANLREAAAARREGLRLRGYDTVLDLELSFGIYGPQGLLAVKAKGELLDLQNDRLLWRNEVASYSVDIFADVKWRDPMQRMTPNITAPRFTIEGDAISQWISDNAAPLRAAFEKAVGDVAAAVLADLGLKESPDGLYTLGAYLLLNGKSESAAEKFTRTIALSPDMQPAINGLAVALAKNKQVDEAITLAEKLVEAHPDSMAAHYNLAWWYAMEKKDQDKARSHYEKAVSLGVSPSRRLEKKMKK
jgi:tetratricopeptide (TPR) repeat protein